MNRSRDEIPDKELRLKIFERDGYICKYCGKKFDIKDLHIDHIRPVSLGGDNRETNLATSCFRCNIEKSCKRIKEFENYDDNDDFDNRYREKVISYGYYTNYIKKVFKNNNINLSRPIIHIYTTNNIKNDEDFFALKNRLKEKGVEFIRREIKHYYILYKNKELWASNIII